MTTKATEKKTATTMKTTETSSKKPSKGPEVKNPGKVVDKSDNNIIVIACSAVGSILAVLVIVVLVVMKMKKKSQPSQKLSEVATPSTDHKRYDPKTFVNASFEPN